MIRSMNQVKLGRAKSSNVDGLFKPTDVKLRRLA
jgi:hypothetical protein